MWVSFNVKNGIIYVSIVETEYEMLERMSRYYNCIKIGKGVVMRLNKHINNITDCDTWKMHRPPKKPDIQWRDGRSAKELARFITNALPNMPMEIEKILKTFVGESAVFDWDAEYVTKLPGSGEGRNHDAILYNDDIIVCIEAKADETLGNLIGEEIKGASVNKLSRICSLLKLLFKDGFKDYNNLRYQLLTASAGTIIEAQERGVENAVLLVVVFKSENHTTKEKLENNNMDIQNFLQATNAVDYENLKMIPNSTGINLYFSKIEIDI